MHRIESAISRLRRLLSAFEILLSDQTLLLAGGDHAAMLATQERSRPVFDEIMALSRESEVKQQVTAADRERVSRLIKRQGEHLQRLAEKKAAVRAELDSLAQSFTRTHELRSAYGSYGAPVRSGGVASFA